MTVHITLRKATLYIATDISFDNPDNTGFKRETNLPPLSNF